MDQLNMYLFEEDAETKAVIVAHNITVAMGKLQAWLNEKNETEEFSQELRLIPSSTGVGDWEAEVRETYKPTNEEIQVKDKVVSFNYQVFELPFAIGKVYGAIGNF